MDVSAVELNEAAVSSFQTLMGDCSSRLDMYLQSVHSECPALTQQQCVAECDRASSPWCPALAPSHKGSE